MVASDFSRKAPATVSNSAFTFYDIESLDTVFTVTVMTLIPNKDPKVDVFLILDDDARMSFSDFTEDKTNELRARMLKENPAIYSLCHKKNPEKNNDISIDFYDLSDPSTHDYFYQVLALPIAGNEPVKDVDNHYDPAQHPFVCGYNSYNYDLTMITIAINLMSQGDIPSAKRLREHNDNLFDKEYIKFMPAYLWRYPSDDLNNASQLKAAMHKTGRHVDIARLNELQQKVALKRLLGMTGNQILESDFSGDVEELIVYNLSDVIGTKLILDDSTYSGSFDLRSGLLHTYPEIVFKRHADSYNTPHMDTTQIHPKRLTIDSSSANFVGRILAPYRNLTDIPGHLADNPVVTFRYPHKSIGTPSNVLTDTRNFLYNLYPDYKTNPKHKEVIDNFAHVYRFYRNIEGCNLNHPSDDRDSTGMELTPQGVINDTYTLLTRARANLITVRDANALPHQAESVVGFLTTTIDLIDATLPVAARQVTGEHVAVSLADMLQLSKQVAGFSQWFRWLDTHLGHHPGLPEGLRSLTDDADTLQRYSTYIEEYFTAAFDSEIPYDPEKDPSITDRVICFPPKQWVPELVVDDIATTPTNMVYVDGNGDPTSCFATFSTGGIHGAEFNEQRYNVEHIQHQRAVDQYYALINTCIDYVTGAIPLEEDDDPRLIDEAYQWANSDKGRMNIPDVPGRMSIDVAAAAWWFRHRKHNNRLRGVEVEDPTTGVVSTHKYTAGITGGSKKDTPYWRKPPQESTTKLFPTKNISRVPLVPDNASHEKTELNQRYTFTSAAAVIHENFTSYYPLLLRNMAAFVNPDLSVDGGTPRDRYSEIFDDKQRYGTEMKTTSDPERKRLLGVLRAGVKLLLNAASGAAAAGHATPIRMNNKIMAMRLIGQMFSWRIGQAQSAAGALIPSTNTDGLYSTLDFDTNQKVLDEHTAAINVDIEPEPLYLVSKDTNNRVEFDLDTFDVLAANGGSLACWAGPSTTKALNHAAILDRILVEYFRLIARADVDTPGIAQHALAEPMDRNIVRSIITKLEDTLDPVSMLELYQNVLASSVGSHTYLYAVPYDPDNPTNALEVKNPDHCEILQHYNRTFIVDPAQVAQTTKPLAPMVVLADAAARKGANSAGRVNAIAAHILKENGVNSTVLTGSEDILLKRHSGVEPDQPMMIVNETLRHNPDKEFASRLLSVIDREAYIDAAINTYNKNWKRTLPAYEEWTKIKEGV